CHECRQKDATKLLLVQFLVLDQLNPSFHCRIVANTSTGLSRERPALPSADFSTVGSSQRRNGFTAISNAMFDGKVGRPLDRRSVAVSRYSRVASFSGSTASAKRR